MPSSCETQSLSHDIFGPGLRDQEVDVPHVDAPVAWRIHAGGSSQATIKVSWGRSAVSHGSKSIPRYSSKEFVKVDTIVFSNLSRYLMYIEGISIFRMFLQVSLRVSLFPQWYLKVSHVHRRYIKVYLTVVAEGILQGTYTFVAEGILQGILQGISGILRGIIGGI